MTHRSGPAVAPATVLFVHSGLNWITGSERCMLDLVAHVDRRRFAPVVWADAPAVVEAAAALGVPAVLARGWDDQDRLLPSRPEIEAAASIVAEHDVQLIHANDTAPIKSVLPVALRRRIPVVAHLHLRLTADERRWALLHQASYAVGVSEAAVRGLREDGFPARRTAVVYNGVDPARLGRGDARGLRASFGIARAHVVFATVGSLIVRKGIDVAIAAFARLCAEREDCWLLLCGDGPEEGRLRAQVQEAGLEARVRFLGRRSDVGAVVRDAVDVLVTAAREESFGLNIAEAGLFGVPAIASDIPAHREVLADDVEGVMVPLEDVAALGRAMGALASDSDRRARLGAAARARTERAFLVDRYVHEFEALYARLLAAPRATYGWTRALTWPRSYTEWTAGAARRRLARAVGLVRRSA